MLVRYSILHGKDGRELSRKGWVYTLEEHGIDRSRVDPDAVRVIRRLREAGFQGYVVGGAVRDLLVGIRPKDFDIATDAHPNAVRKLFRSARVIGRRFRLVHVYSRRDKYLEVATFRAGGDGESPYGSMAEDAWRRDFTLNALYYCPVKQQVVDYVGGVKDIRARRMRTIARERDSFTEDPVRIIRAVKHAELVGFRLPLGMRRAIRKLGGGLASCSPQRVTEELYKILRCGRSKAVIRQCYRLGVLRSILPELHASLAGSRARERRLWERLDEVDGATDREGGRETPTGRLLAALLAEAIAPSTGASPRQVVERLRAAAAPLIPSNHDLRVAASILARSSTARP